MVTPTTSHPVLPGMRDSFVSMAIPSPCRIHARETGRPTPPGGPPYLFRDVPRGMTGWSARLGVGQAVRVDRRALGGFTSWRVPITAPVRGRAGRELAYALLMPLMAGLGLVYLLVVLL